MKKNTYAFMEGIADRRRAEEARQSSEARYCDLFENVSDIIYTLDLEGNLTSLNKSGERTTGYAREEILGQNISRLIAPEFQELAHRLTEQAFVSEPLAPYKLEIVTKDSRRVALEVSHRLIYHQNGALAGVQGIARDVSERRQLLLQLLQSQKMEAIGRLVGGMVHDFANYVEVMIGCSEQMLARLRSDDPLRSDVGMLKDAALRSASLTRRLLSFSRREAIEPRILDLNGVISDLEKMLRPLLGQQIELVTSLDAALGRVKADPVQMDQVIVNLAVNARDAMPQGGRLTIETANVELDKEYARQHSPVQPGDYVMLAVSDTGVGIDKETQSRIFEPFFTTKEKGKGTGLGLAMVYGIVKQSGGYIWVESEPGHGATFKIYFPWLEANLQDAERASASTRKGEEIILVVEGQEGMRELACRYLQSSGYTVLQAGKAAEAIEISKRHEGPVHLLITDTVIPGMSGRKLAQRLRGHRPNVKVLYMSGYPDDVVFRRGLLGSKVAFLQKPFTRRALTGKVKAVLGDGKRATK